MITLAIGFLNINLGADIIYSYESNLPMPSISSSLSNVYPIPLVSTFSKKLDVPEETIEHLSGIVNQNLYDGNLLGMNPKFGHIWYNRYDRHHYQDAHIHPNCQWSFIIYVDLHAKTSFLNPSIGLIQNQIGNSVAEFPLDYKPDLGPGSIIIFPSFLMHMVNSGNEGTTISGNVYMEYQ